MNPVSLNQLPADGKPKGPDSPEKIRDAAEQFEALLISQILRSAREASDVKGDCATEFAERHMANCLAHQGGLGLAAMISASFLKTPVR